MWIAPTVPHNVGVRVPGSPTRGCVAHRAVGAIGRWGGARRPPPRPQRRRPSAHPSPGCEHWRRPSPRMWRRRHMTASLGGGRPCVWRGMAATAFLPAAVSCDDYAAQVCWFDAMARGPPHRAISVVACVLPTLAGRSWALAARCELCDALTRCARARPTPRSPQQVFTHVHCIVTVHRRGMPLRACCTVGTASRSLVRRPHSTPGQRA